MHFCVSSSHTSASSRSVPDISSAACLSCTCCTHFNVSFGRLAVWREPLYVSVFPRGQRVCLLSRALTTLHSDPCQALRLRMSTARKFDLDLVSMPCLSLIGAHTQDTRLQRYLYLLESRGYPSSSPMFLPRLSLDIPYDLLYTGLCTGHRLSTACRVCNQLV